MEYNISKNQKYASSIQKLNQAYPDLIKPIVKTDTTTVTPVNTVVAGGDPNSEVAKKTAEANATVDKTSQAQVTNVDKQNTETVSSGNDFSEVDLNTIIS